MIRHKEFIRLLLGLVTISLLGTVGGYFIAPIAAVSIAVTSGLIIIVTILFTHFRYREINRLSRFLRQISNGDFSLDVRDNYEGELSILKSEIYKVTTKLQEQSHLLQADKTHLTNAISDISHQLKTPLTSMTMMADLLSSDSLPADKRAEFTQTIRLQLERIEWLVSALLKLSKIDAGTTRFKRSPVLVNDVVEMALESVVIPVDIKALQLIVEGDRTAVMVADENWTGEALINILKNAVTHTPDNGMLHISFVENVLYTEITITDNGPGIAKSDVPNIFKRFYRGKNASDDSVGIGLAMAYSIVKEQGGDIEVKSSPEGTEFKLKFYRT